MNAWETIAALHLQGTDAVVVTITGTRGSVPGEAGGKAVVTAEGRVAGNLGGGKVEARAVVEAQAMLTDDGANCRTHTWNLQRDVGMTCGGEMSFLFEKVSAQAPWHLVIFGAGHVSQALVPVLATLKCRIDVIDPRAEWLSRIAASEKVRLWNPPTFAEGVRQLGESSYLICITQGHATDRPVLRDAFRKFARLPYVGVIGSAAKRAVLLRELREDGIPEEMLERLVCPLGLPVGGNAPEEIAISIAAQLLKVKAERLKR